MKKIIAALMAACLVLSGCGSAGTGFRPGRCTNENGTYRNDPFDVTFTYDDGAWAFCSDEEMADIYGQAAADMFPDGDALEKAVYIADAYGYNADYGTVVSFSYENLGEYAEAFDEDAYIETTIGNLESYADGLEATEKTVKNGFTYVDMTITYGDSVSYERLAVKKVSDWMAIVAISGVTYEELDPVYEGLKG